MRSRTRLRPHRLHRGIPTLIKTNRSDGSGGSVILLTLRELVYGSFVFGLQVPGRKGTVGLRQRQVRAVRRNDGRRRGVAFPDPVPRRGRTARSRPSCGPHGRTSAERAARRPDPALQLPVGRAGAAPISPPAPAYRRPRSCALIARLGFSSYADFQRRLRQELEARLESPLAKGEAAAGSRDWSRRPRVSWKRPEPKSACHARGGERGGFRRHHRPPRQSAAPDRSRGRPLYRPARPISRQSPACVAAGREPCRRAACRLARTRRGHGPQRRPRLLRHPPLPGRRDPSSPRRRPPAARRPSCCSPISGSRPSPRSPATWWRRACACPRTGTPPARCSPWPPRPCSPR